MEKIKAFFTQEEGQGMVEYGLILALVAIIAMAGLEPIGTAALATFNAVATALQ